MIGMPTNSEFDFSSFALQDAQKQSSRNELGQEEFLMLMLTQLQNQDPTKPMEDGEFIAQMAQFTTVEELGGMSKSIENLASSLTSSSALQAATMVGRSVLVEGESGVSISSSRLAMLLSGCLMPAASLFGKCQWARKTWALASLNGTA